MFEPGLLYPDIVIDGAINRQLLAQKIIKQEASLKDIEAVVHPLVALKRRQFLEEKSAEGNFLLVCDIPLLLENPSSYKDIDYIVVASASAEVQRQRCLQRPGMTLEKLDTILSKQMPDEEKRKRAQFIINTDYKGFSEAKRQVAQVIESLIARHPSLWNAWKGRHSPQSKTTSCSNAIDIIRSHIDLVIFDLDDTLVPTSDPINRANAKVDEFMKEKMPQTRSNQNLRLLIARLETSFFSIERGMII